MVSRELSRPLVLEPKSAVSASDIYAMRYSGATLRQIADKIGRTKERVRQILLKNYGSTRHKLFSTKKACEMSGLSYHKVMKLCEDGVISPVVEWDTISGHHYLWSHAGIEKIKVFRELAKTNRNCRICGAPVPEERQNYCSEHCYKESHKYRYRSLEAREKHRTSMRRYKKMRKLAQAAGKL